MNILVACEYSGRVRDAFSSRGHYAVSCDLLPSESSGLHIVGDVREIAKNNSWDLIIAHPPCQYLANSGSRWIPTQPDRLVKQKTAAEFFRFFLDLPTPTVVENPIPSARSVELIGRKYDQLIQPWWFGEPYTKATCLWLHKSLPPLKATHKSPTGHEVSYTDICPRNKNRAKQRAKTFKSIAAAMARTWG